MGTAAFVFGSPRRLSVAEWFGARVARLVTRRGRIRHLPPPFSAWTRRRDVPAIPLESFRTWWKRNDHS